MPPATAPSTPAGLDAVVSGRTAALVWDVSTDNLSGVSGYTVKYSHDGQEFTISADGTGFVLNDLALGTWNWSVQAIDAAGNASAVTSGSFTVSDVTPPDPGIESTARNDINGNGISDVTFQWTGGDNQIGFWMNGSAAMKAGLNLSTCPTCTFIPASSANFFNALASSGVATMGFSMKTCLRFCKALDAHSK